MYGLDNASGVNVMPKLAPVSSATPLWFTEGGAGLAASYPGQDWFNMIQAELLGLLSAGGLKPEKGKLTQLADAVKKIVNSADFQPSGSYATTTALANGLALKFDKTSVVQSTGTSTTQVMSQGAATKLFIKPGDAGIGGSAERIYVDALASLQGKPSGFYHSGGDILNLPFSGQWHEFVKIMLTETYGSLFSLSASNQVSTNVLNNGAWSGWATLFGESNTYTDHNNVIKKSNAYLSDYPVGSPIPWPQSAAPSGFLICNGQSFNKATYPLLAAAYPSGALPDLRGEFIRGFDSGRGVDASRTVLSVQGHALQGHGHTFAYNRTNTTEDNPGTGAAIHRDSITLSATNRVGEPVTLAGFGEVKLATETRPRNIAYLYIVRAA
ncbi:MULTISPECIES: tail fiber protein [Providencia]|uniref:tail fiber protein n=1 Tax=Providencia TaxID=586 RepID=UPI0015EC55C2|nr:MULTISPECIES: tail fiber protein [Providencia]QLQ64038.1 tail fiber protein [Providencia rettgeri]URR24154.1 phage tail protein [Providencia rettgeri]